ncbi:MAG: thiamine pyrophosphate-dependent enzyme [Elusimicrobiota bacterium]
MDAGIKGAYAYPGTPSTEIMEYLVSAAQADGAFHARWSANEKVAFEEALGMSLIGRRAIVCMKHVGLNVAADPFMNSALTGAGGGLVVVVADDPGMHSSQNEQDSRYYAEFAKIPCFEPADQQECYDMTREAFALSEMCQTPVMVRIVTRIAHARSPIETHAPETPSGDALEDFRSNRELSRRWTLLPANARRQFIKLLERQTELESYSHDSNFNVETGGGGKLGVLCSGVGAAYATEALALAKLDLPSLKLGVYPISRKKLKSFIGRLDEVLVVEDGYPFIEERLLGWIGAGPRIRGRLDGTLPRTGEMDTNKALRALAALTGKPAPAEARAVSGLPPRPPALCAGCPHTDTFRALNEAVAGKKPANVFSDIGCYALGVLPPHQAINSCVEMGASLGMAKGASEGGLTYSVAVLGESTFAHSGLASLRGAAIENTPMTLIILDNGTVAMTGGQESAATGEALVSMVKGLGADPRHVRLIDPLPRSHAENVKIIREELEHRGLSVIISQRECVQTARKSKKKGRSK